jgi:predicted protein tyrosine phosphatase
MNDIPFPNAYWVLPGQLMAGEYPAHRYDVDLTRARLRALLESGIRVFIDLTQPGELASYQTVLEEQAKRLSLAVDYARFPIQDLSTPNRGDMKTILDRVDQGLLDGSPVYVHCQGGIGRTGTVVGCLLVRHTLEPDAALSKIAELRKGAPNENWRSPESDEQVNFVKSWKAWE